MESAFAGPGFGQKIAWPENKKFAFTVFDDTDEATLESVPPVYDMLADLGFHTTKSAWLFDMPSSMDPGHSCENPVYFNWLKILVKKGFEIGYHMAGSRSSKREVSRLALERFSLLFGHDPCTAANHMECRENMYWGKDRLNGTARLAYGLRTLFSSPPRFTGHVENDPYFWGDLCRDKILFFRNLVFGDINTLSACPYMPYHDPKMPWVNYWFASSEGSNVVSFNQTISEANQEKLEKENGACIMYTHFSRGFSQNGKVHSGFRRLMERLALKNGWFVPAGKLLRFLLDKKGPHSISPIQREIMEWKWIAHKLRVGQT